MHPLINAQDLLAICPSVIILLNSCGQVEFINQTGEEKLGYLPGDIIGKNWFGNFVSKEYRCAERIRFAFMLQNPGTHTEPYENQIVNSKGHSNMFRWRSLVKKDDKGNASALVCSGEDITEKKILQKKLASVDKEKRRLAITAALEAQEKERFYIANELHDNVGQILTTCKLLLEVELQNQNQSRFIINTHDYLQAAIHEIRILAHHLNPAQLSEIGLNKCIEELVAKINSTGKIRIFFTSAQSCSASQLCQDLSLSLFRIIQEQLNNIIKHANAAQVNIHIYYDEEAVELEIADDGIGFNKAEVPRGLGLNNIYNRAELFGGRALLNTSIGEGCTLSIYIPLQTK